MECLEQHFIANGVPEDKAERFKPRATLISVIGSKVYYVLTDTCSPETPSGKPYDDLATILKGHFATKKLVIAERHRFHNFIQREGESVSTFAANLKHFTSTCNFGTHLNEALRDHFVCGLRSKEIQKKLLTEEHNFDEALKNALGAEAAEKDVAASSQEVATPVNKLDLSAVGPIVLANHATLQARAKATSHLARNKIGALAEKQVTHVPSANTGTIHAILVVDRVISQMYARVNLRRSTRWKSQKLHKSTSLQIHFLSQSTTLLQRTMASKYPLN